MWAMRPSPSAASSRSSTPLSTALSPTGALLVQPADLSFQSRQHYCRQSLEEFSNAAALCVHANSNLILMTIQNISMTDFMC